MQDPPHCRNNGSHHARNRPEGQFHGSVFHSRDHLQQDLYTTFESACEGGVRDFSAYQVLVLVSNFVAPRHTGGKWQENILYYTGSSKTGDQDINKGANKRLLTSLETSTPIYYFEVHTQGQYTYRGQVLRPCRLFSAWSWAALGCNGRCGYFSCG